MASMPPAEPRVTSERSQMLLVVSSLAVSYRKMCGSYRLLPLPAFPSTPIISLPVATVMLSRS
jgi:hypothetical protein